MMYSGMKFRMCSTRRRRQRFQKFFENNLNISETARQLYVHRNTLVYRLERLEKVIGLDIRKFDDAMTFKIAMMVISHMQYVKNSDNALN